MHIESLAPLGLVFIVAACSVDSGAPSGGAGTNATGGKGGGTGGQASGGGGVGGASAGSGTGGSTPMAGTSGSTSLGGSAGTATGGGAGSPAGSAGVATGGMGGSAEAGSGGAPSGGTGGENAGAGGANVGGAGMGGAGMGGAGMGGAAGSDTTGPVTVQLAQTRQLMEGFGINDSYASGTIPAKLFDATADIGLTILRVGMNSSGGFMTSNVQTADIAMVKAIPGTKVIGSCWSAPANCKSNNNENDGGHLNTSCYTSWATTITNFAKTNGLYGMSVGNEPDFASCGRNNPCNGNYATMLYTANEMVAFVKVVGPMLKKEGIKVIAPEASEWNHLWSNVSAGPNPGGKNSSDPLKCGFPPDNPDCDAGKGYDYGHYLARDAEAWGAIDIIGTHEYDSQVANPWPSDVMAARKPVWQTEMSGVKWWPEEGPSSDIANGVAVAGWVHSGIVVGDASAWLYWWYSTSNDNEGLMLGSTDTKRHYTFGNFSKFVRPGYTRVEISGAIPANVLLSAYKSPEGKIVVVAINKGNAEASLPIAIAGTAPTGFTPWVTSANDNLASKAAVAVSNGSFTAALGAMTVTTFVAN